MRMKWSEHESTTHFRLMSKIRMRGVESLLPLRLHGKYTFMSPSNFHDDLSTKKIHVTSRRELLCPQLLFCTGCISISRHGKKLATYRHTFIPHYHQNVFTEITAEPQHITMRNFRGMANYLMFLQEPKFVHFT